MTLKEFYDEIDGSYEQMLQRMMGNEQMILRFLKKFIQDGTYKELEQAMEMRSCDGVFRAAHTLKGITGNLGLEPLYKESAGLTELTRNGGMSGVEESFERLREQYEKILKLIDMIV